MRVCLPIVVSCRVRLLTWTCHVASPSQAGHRARCSSSRFGYFHSRSGLYPIRSHRFRCELATAARGRPHMGDHGIFDRRDRSAFLFAVGHEPIDAALVCAGGAKAVALSALCALKCGIAARVTVVSVLGRTARRARRTTLGLGRRLWPVFGLLLFQRSKRGALGRSRRIERELCSRFALAWKPRSMVASAAVDRLGGLRIRPVARNDESHLSGHRR